MKKMILMIMLLCAHFLVAGQATDGTIKYDKLTQKAIVIEYAYPEEAVQNAFLEKMASMGHKGKEERGLFNRDKGFVVFKNAYVQEITEDGMDYIIKVDRKSRRDSDESVLHMIMMKNGENAWDKMEAYDIGRAKLFLTNLLPDIEAAHLELQIKEQEEVVAKAEKDLQNLRDEQDDLEKRLKKNKQDQEDAVKDIENQRKALEELINRRKSN